MLTVRERMALEIAATPYRYPAVRDGHVIDQLGWTPTRFWQVVDALLDRPDALEEYPQTVSRLRRLRDSRAQQRSGRRAG
jgi:hypothetical protein